MAVILTLQSSTSLPIELESVLPETCVGKSIAEIERLEIFHGKEKLPLAEFFRIEGNGDEEVLQIRGDCRSVHWIGAKMTRGQIQIEGDAGRHLGSQMNGGEIKVSGSCGDWLGAEMRGGRIEIRGDATHQVGAAYRGSSRF
jgi:formylmethanofuran dehydrogenase subunit C